MVQLTPRLCKYIPEWYHIQQSASNYFKKQALFHMTRFNRDIGWSTRKNAINRFQYYLKGENVFNKLHSSHRRDNNRSRIAAACQEHGYKYSYLMSTLPKLNIQLNLSSLAKLSIYEPRTFKSLVDICRTMTNEPVQEGQFDQAKL